MGMGRSMTIYLFLLLVVIIRKKKYVGHRWTREYICIHKHIYTDWSDRLLSKSVANVDQCPEALVCEPSWERFLFWIISKAFCFRRLCQLSQLILHVRSWSSVCDNRGGNARRNRGTPQKQVFYFWINILCNKVKGGENRGKSAIQYQQNCC